MVRIPALLTLALLASYGDAFAEIHWDKPVQEFHRSPQDRSIVAKYAFKNTGTSAVTIDNIRTSCGCTSADLEKRTYGPGESGEVTVKFTFGSRVGPQRKTIRVFTSDNEKEPTVLDLRVYIEEAVTVTPSLVFWRVGEPATAKAVQITTQPSPAVKIKGVRTSDPSITAKLEPINPGESYKVTITPTATNAKQSVEISVDTDYPPDAPRTYLIYARIK
jgi:hypothetical protein